MGVGYRDERVCEFVIISETHLQTTPNLVYVNLVVWSSLGSVLSK